MEELEARLVEKRYYVYALCYPDGPPFYIGKGTSGRIHCHEAGSASGSARKEEVIREIKAAGAAVKKEIFLTTDDEDEAYAEERRLITLHHHQLTNVQFMPPPVRPDTVTASIRYVKQEALIRLRLYALEKNITVGEALSEIVLKYLP